MSKKFGFVRKLDVSDILCNRFCACSPEECEFKLTQKGENYCPTIRAILKAPGEDVVPWGFLISFAYGGRHNFDSDFVLEAQKAWQEITEGERDDSLS